MPLEGIRSEMLVHNRCDFKAVARQVRHTLANSNGVRSGGLSSRKLIGSSSGKQYRKISERTSIGMRRRKGLCSKFIFSCRAMRLVFNSTMRASASAISESIFLICLHGEHGWPPRVEQEKFDPISDWPGKTSWRQSEKTIVQQLKVATVLLGNDK